MDNDIVSKRISIALKQSPFSQADIVKKTGINKGALSSYLTGRYIPKQSNIYKLSEVLDVSPAWLMGFDVPMHEPRRDILGTELENIFIKLSAELNIPLEELKNIFINHNKQDNNETIELNYNNLYDFFLDYFKIQEKYKQILKNKGLMDNNDNINDKTIDKLIQFAIDNYEKLSKNKD